MQSGAQWPDLAIPALLGIILISVGVYLLKGRDRGSHNNGSHNNKTKKAKPLPETGPRSEKKLAKKMAEAGQVRMCRFCEVRVDLDQTEVHVGGKKHKRLAGTTDTAECWRWVDAAKPPLADSQCKAAPELPTHQEVASTMSASGSGWKTASKKGPSKKSGARPRFEDYRSLPTLGFKVVDGVEPILPLIRSGHKTIELRRKGSRLSDGSIMDRLQVGDRFVGVPLADRLTYRCVMELCAPVEGYASHGAAWEAHREKAVPRSLGVIRSAREAQRFYEKAFYDGRELVDEPVLAIPVRVLAWFE